jgi:hypothetical protein
MIITIQDPLTREKCKNASISKLLIGVRKVQEIYLQHQFEEASTDATALAVIIITEGLGFIAQAEQMKSLLKQL